jgi:hypothetical protein
MKVAVITGRSDIGEAGCSTSGGAGARPVRADRQLHQQRDRVRITRRACQRGRPGSQSAAYDAASYEGIAGPIGQISGSATSFDAILYLEQATLVTGETLRVDGGQAAGH